MKKSKKTKNKSSFKTIVILLIIAIISVFTFSKLKTTKKEKPSDITKDTMMMWFPKNKIIVVQNTNDYYVLSDGDMHEREFPIKKETIENIIKNNKEITKIIAKYEDSGMVKNMELSGLFNSAKDKVVPYYLITYQKENEYCQLNFKYECLDVKSCLDDPIVVACKTFDFDKVYKEQEGYYDILLSINPDFDRNYAEAISKVQKSSSGNILITTYAWVDGGDYYISKNNKLSCVGKPCCDVNDKNNKDLWGPWCEEQYQTVDSYK